MTFEIDNFFSAEIEQLRKYVRNLPATKPWFEFALEINRLAINIMKDHTVPNVINQELLATIFFSQTHQIFQASIILLEHALIGEARSLLRGGVEGVVAAYANEADSNFIELLKSADIKHHQTILNEAKDPKLGHIYTQEGLAGLSEKEKKLSAILSSLKSTPSKMNWASLADKYCKEIYHTLYRNLSEDGAHITVATIRRFVELNASKNQIAYVKTAPDLTKIVESLHTANFILLYAMPPFINLVGKRDCQPAVQEMAEKINTLPLQEPVIN